MIRVRQLIVYPIKALDGVAVQQARVLPGGALEEDRRFALFDSHGRFINGKRVPHIVRLRATYSDDLCLVHLHSELDGISGSFDLVQDALELTQFLRNFLGQEVHLVERKEGGFPDDTEASGPTIVSYASLERVAEWFAPLTAEQVCQRVRPNVILDNCVPFWEDSLAQTAGTRFQIGSVSFEAMRICRRCIVPSLQPGTAERWPGFERRFMEQRWTERPQWSPLTGLQDSYRFAINTRGLATGVIHVGDPVCIASETHAE